MGERVCHTHSPPPPPAAPSQVSLGFFADIYIAPSRIPGAQWLAERGAWSCKYASGDRLDFAFDDDEGDRSVLFRVQDVVFNYDWRATGRGAVADTPGAPRGGGVSGGAAVPVVGVGLLVAVVVWWWCCCC